MGEKMKKICLLNVDQVKEELMHQMEIAILDITDADAKCTVEQLLAENFDRTVPNREDELVLMSELSEAEMNEVSQILKTHDLHPIQVAVTEYNIHWTLSDLLEEVRKEHVLFLKMNELGQLMKALNEVKDLQLSFEEKMTIMECFSLFQDANVTMEKLENAIAQMIQILKKSS